MENMTKIDKRKACYLCRREFDTDVLFDVTIDGIGRVPITYDICESCLKDNVVYKNLEGVTNDYATCVESENDEHKQRLEYLFAKSEANIIERG